MNNISGMSAMEEDDSTNQATVQEEALSSFGLTAMEEEAADPEEEAISKATGPEEEETRKATGPEEALSSIGFTDLEEEAVPTTGMTEDAFIEMPAYTPAMKKKKKPSEVCALERLFCCLRYCFVVCTVQLGLH